jgi:hypothetical protein
MSEYQHYELQAVGRPLTQDQTRDLRTYSTRAKITSRSFVIEYNWGDFKDNSDQWIETFFDAFLYLANWGTRWFMLRVPGQFLDPETASVYCTVEALAWRIKGDYLLVSFRSEEEQYEWSKGYG